MEMRHVKLFENYNVDKILDKISASGIESITNDEKRYLDLHSKDSTNEDEDEDMENIQNKMSHSKLISILKELNIIDDSIADEAVDYKEDSIDLYDVLVYDNYDMLSDEDKKSIKGYFMENYMEIKLHDNNIIEFRFEDYGEDIDDEERSLLIDMLMEIEIHNEYEFVMPQMS
jgi:hypothetical protein